MKNKSVMSNFPVCLLAAFCILTIASIAFGESAQAKQSYEITVTSGENGQITPATRSFKKGKNAVFTVKPGKGFKIDTITVDGEDIDLSNLKKPWNPHKYVFKKVDAAHTISATFKADMKISPSAYILKIGASKKFYVTDSRGKKLPKAIINWAIDDQNTATVSNDGLVTAKGEGTLNIFATYEGMIVEDVTPVIIDPLNIKVVAPPMRPVELIDIFPEENLTFDLCESYPVRIGGMSITFGFKNGDVLDSYQLLLDGIDITSDSEISTGANSVNTYISYSLTCNPKHDVNSHTLSDGIHEVTVNGTSKAGKVVSYTWSFVKK